MNREERLHRLEAAYYGARLAYIDTDRAVRTVRSSANKFETACVNRANRDAACARMFDAARKLHGEIDYE